MIAASLAGARVGGRCVELAKRDIWSAARVAQERPDMSYPLLAVDFLPPAVLRSSLRDVAVQVREVPGAGASVTWQHHDIMTYHRLACTPAR